MASPLLVFDLDGTLVDSRLDLVPALNLTIVPEGLAPVGLAEVGKIIGHGARRMIERAYKLQQISLDEAVLDRLFAAFLVHYEGRIAEETVVFPGVIALMDRLSDLGWRFAICTNKPEHLSNRLLDELGLVSRFATVCGGDTFAVRKPDAAHFVGTVERAGGSMAQAVLVGDSVTDRDTARNAGIPFAGVTFGYSDVPMVELAPDILVERFDDISADDLAGLFSQADDRAAGTA